MEGSSFTFLFFEGCFLGPARMKGLEDGSKLLQYYWRGVVLESGEFFGRRNDCNIFFSNLGWHLLKVYLGFGG